MPVRATKRGAERTALDVDCDVLICGGSFAGLTVARELAGTGARVLVVDRYDIGEKQTSACGIPTEWLRAMGLMDAWQQEFAELVVHTPHRVSRHPLPWTFSTFDYRTACALLWDQSDAEFETAKVEGRTRDTVHTDRGDLRAPLIVDGLGWRRVLGREPSIQPPDAFLSRGLEVHPNGRSDDLAIWVDRSYVPDGYAWSFPADHEQRVGVGSFDPSFHVKEPTNRLAADLGVDRVNYQGNWIPHRIRPATEDGVFFCGDSAGHCIPLTAEGIRTAMYFGLAVGRELRAVHEGRKTREEALRDYSAFNARHVWKFEAMLGWQRALPRIPPRALTVLLRGIENERATKWNFDKYLNIAHPRFVGEGPPARARRPRAEPPPLAAAA